MTRMFGVDISGIINREIGGRLTDAAQVAVLTKSTPGTRTGNLTGGTNPTTTDYTGKGFIDTQARAFLDGSLVRDGMLIIVLIGDSLLDTAGALGVPDPGDRITIESVTYQIPEDGRIDRDPAAATYTCEVRKQ